MKIKTAYIIETAIRLISAILTLPFFIIGYVLLCLAKPFDWIVTEARCLVDKIGHYLFLKSKMAQYVKNEKFKEILTARGAYKLKRQLLEELPYLSENEF